MIPANQLAPSTQLSKLGEMQSKLQIDWACHRCERDRIRLGAFAPVAVTHVADQDY